MEAAVTLVELYKGTTKRFAQKDLKSLCLKCGGYVIQDLTNAIANAFYHRYNSYNIK